MTQPQPTDLVLGGTCQSKRRTQKLVSAFEVANSLSISLPDRWIPDQLYTILEQNGYFWRSSQKTWIREFEVNPPSTALRMRLVFNSEHLKSELSTISALLKNAGYEILDVSKFYIRRPPEHLDSSVYLLLLPPSD